MVEAVMLWNEPNNLSHWNFELDPNWKIFADMAQLASSRIRQINPGMKIVLGGVSACDCDFLRLMAVTFEAVFRKDGADVFVELQLGLIGGNAMARDHRRKQNNDDARGHMRLACSKAHRFQSLHHACRKIGSPPLRLPRFRLRLYQTC